MKTENQKRPESAVQFDAIWDKHNDPEERERRKILKNREERANNKKKETGYA